MISERKLAAVKKCFKAWGGALYVIEGAKDHPPPSYWTWCKAVAHKRKMAAEKDTAKLIEMSIDLINKRRGS